MGGNKGRVRVVKKKAKATVLVKKKRPRDKPKGPMAACYFCKKMVDEREYLCGGCNQVICDGSQCDQGIAPWGEHEPEAHREEQ
jgi:hypothetical protein